MTNMILFEKRESFDVAKSMGYKIDKANILDEVNNPVKCYFCKHKITTRNLGYIVKGSKIVFCDNPVCAATYIEEHIS